MEQDLVSSPQLYVPAVEKDGGRARPAYVGTKYHIAQTISNIRQRFLTISLLNV